MSTQDNNSSSASPSSALTQGPSRPPPPDSQFSAHPHLLPRRSSSQAPAKRRGTDVQETTTERELEGLRVELAASIEALKDVRHEADYFTGQYRIVSASVLSMVNDLNAAKDSKEDLERRLADAEKREKELQDLLDKTLSEAPPPKKSKLGDGLDKDLDAMTYDDDLDHARKLAVDRLGLLDAEKDRVAKAERIFAYLLTRLARTEVMRQSEADRADSIVDRTRYLFDDSKWCVECCLCKNVDADFAFHEAEGESTIHGCCIKCVAGFIGAHYSGNADPKCPICRRDLGVDPSFKSLPRNNVWATYARPRRSDNYAVWKDLSAEIKYQHIYFQYEISGLSRKAVWDWDDAMMWDDSDDDDDEDIDAQEERGWNALQPEVVSFTNSLVRERRMSMAVIAADGDLV